MDDSWRGLDNRCFGDDFGEYEWSWTTIDKKMLKDWTKNVNIPPSGWSNQSKRLLKNTCFL